MAKEYRQHRWEVPDGAVDLVLVRHGESAPARPGESFPLVEGHGDPELHPVGHLQAQAVCDRLAREPIDALYVTILRRTHQTLAPLAERTGIEPRVERDLREVHLGEWEGGLYRIKVAEGDPAYLRALEAQDWQHIPGAESNAAVMQRVGATLARIEGRHRGQKVVACVHGGIIAAIMAMATGARPFAFLGAENGSISRMVLQEGRIRVRSFNDTSHLEGLDPS